MFKEIIKRIWGLAKGGLNLHDDELYSVLYRETGKESMRECTEQELRRVALALEQLKGLAEAGRGRASKKQVWKIRQLEQELGWGDNQKRLNGFIKKQYGVERPEWLSTKDAWRLIEGLKKILERGKKDGDGQDVSNHR